jgi:peptide/nickel transport system substrate-binding protein
MDQTRRALLESGAGVFGTAALGGCLTQSEDDENVFRIGSPWTPGSIDPAVDGSILKRIGIMETLVAANYEAEVAPGLATSWSTDEDAQVWEFELRDDVVFHDSSTMDADTTVTALQQAFEAPVLADVPLEGIDAVDENRIRASAANSSSDAGAWSVREPV